MEHQGFGTRGLLVMSPVLILFLTSHRSLLSGELSPPFIDRASTTKPCRPRLLDVAHTILISCFVYTLTITYYGRAQALLKFTCLYILIVFGSAITWTEQVKSISPPKKTCIFSKRTKKLTTLCPSLILGFLLVSHLESHESILPRCHLFSFIIRAFPCLHGVGC